MNLGKDPIIQRWENNYDENVLNKAFNGEDVRPYKFLLNNTHYHNVPVVLVAAGPSLDNNLKYLKDFQKNAIILAVDVILFKLLEYDIIPDFVVNIDPSDMFIRFWEDLDTSNLTLICPTTTHPKVLQTWKGRKFFYNQIDQKKSEKGRALKRLIKTTAGYGKVINRYFIGATSAQIASIFNPDPLILVGYDFAYTGGKAYCDGFLERKIYDDTTEKGSPEHIRNINSLKYRERNEEMKVKDIYGMEVYTSKQLNFYSIVLIHLLYNELRIKNVINATEGGVLKDTPNMSLKNALNQYCKSEIQKKDVFSLIKRKKKRRKK